MIRINNIFKQFTSIPFKLKFMALTRKEAQLRTDCFSTQEYIKNTLYVELLKGKRYKALAKTYFNLSKKDPQLFLDWQGEAVSQIDLNGSTVEVNDLICKNKRIYMPEENLKVGLNEITIKFENDYSTSGHGLHSFVDTDGHQYVYSQLEPYHASRMFPCFDQPDLKGSFKLFALAPQEFTVISNEKRLEFNKDHLQTLAKHDLFQKLDEQQIWEFENTKPLSTYLYAILSGPYTEIVSPKQYIHNGVSMSLFCRTSLLKHLEKDTEEIFSMTYEGLKFYEELFGYPYPFSKYDQIFCPEYSSGAMENAGAVTVNDSYIFKEEVPVSQRADRANTILHELSHMWFGDLVTMQWWDDLWLNESFAEFISHLCQWKIKQKELSGVDVWVSFYERKIWGYIEDQLVTTHPIYCEIDNTDQSENIFDGITYAKGAAIIKQLYSMMGEKTFSKAMKIYFNKYQYKNTTLSDFFGVIQQAFEEDKINIDLNRFREQWIMKAGLNQIKAQIQGDQFIVDQSAVLASHPTLRDQIFKVAFFGQDGQVLLVKQIHLKDVPQTTLKFDDLDLTKVKGFLLNYNDESFLKTLYSPEQVEFLMAHMSKIQPSLSRALALRSIWDQVRDGETCFLNFVDGVVNHISKEQDDSINKMILQWCSGGLDFYSPRRVRGPLRERLALTVATTIAGTENENKNKLLVMKQYLTSWSKSPQQLKELQHYINPNYMTELAYGDIGLANGWRVIKNIFAYSDIPLEEKWALFEVWAVRDGSDQCQKNRRFINALLHADRVALWNSFLNYNKEESVQMAGQAMSGFNHDIYLKDLEQYEKQYFDILPTIFKSKESEYAKQFFNSLYPIGENIDYYQQRCQELLDQNLGNDILTKQLKASIDSDSRRKKTYATFPQL